MNQAIESRKSSSSSGVGQGNGHKKLPSASSQEPAAVRKKPVNSSGVVALGFAFAGGCGTNNARRFMASVAPGRLSLSIHPGSKHRRPPVERVLRPDGSKFRSE